MKRCLAGFPGGRRLWDGVIRRDVRKPMSSHEAAGRGDLGMVAT